MGKRKRKPKSGLGIRRADLKFGHYIRRASGLEGLSYSWGPKGPPGHSEARAGLRVLLALLLALLH